MRIKLFTALTAALLAMAIAPAIAQAETPKFQVRCQSSHIRTVDPIVAPGPSGTPSAHQHEFFGNRSVDSNSTLASMRAAATTCSTMDDTAGYWTPTLIGPGGGVVRADSMLVYYRGGPKTRAFPADLKMISDHFHIGGNADGRLLVGFPSCWDGQHLDSPNHMSHMSFKRNGQSCPSSHPVELPHVTEVFRYSVMGTWPMGYGLSSGGFATGHADFWNTWNQPALERLVSECLNASRVCGRIGNG